MKITVISIFFPPERGAAPSRILNMSKALKERGCDVEVVTALANYPKGKIFEKYRGKIIHKEVIEGIPCRRYWLMPSNSNNPFVRVLSMFSFAISLFMALPYLIRRRSDIIIVQSPPLLAGFSGALLGSLAPGKVISNISDVWPLTALELGVIKKGAIYSFFEVAEKWIYRISDAFMTQSEESLEHINKFNDKPKFCYSNLSLPSPFKGPAYQKDGIKIVYAGLLGLAQGVNNICRQIDFKGLGVEFHIYGHGVERADIEQYIQENPDSNIILHESIPKNEVPEMLSNFHATIIPLKDPIYGALPSKIFMAIASELPILFSGEGEGRRIVEEKNIGWVCDSQNYKALEHNIQKIISSENEYQTKKDAIVAVHANEFNYFKLQDRLIEFLKECLNLS